MNKLFFNYKNNYIKGFAIIELIVVIAILGIIMIAVGDFSVKVITNNKYSQDSLSSAQDARVVIRTMVKEIRTASRGNNGAYPIETANADSISFFSDINGDGKKEQIRYFILNGILKKGLISPTGSPLAYNSANEVISTLAYNVKNTSLLPLFEYFDNKYSGTGSPLTQPISSLLLISLVKINLIIDSDPNKAPVTRTYTTQVSIRNLKDNL